MKKKVLFAAAFMLATVGAYAQGNGIAGITEKLDGNIELAIKQLAESKRSK